MNNYHRLWIAGPDEMGEFELPEQVQLAVDDLAAKVREGLLALSVGAGLKVMDELIERSSPAFVAPKASKIPSAQPTPRQSPIQGRARRAQVTARRPRARSTEGCEVPLRTWELFRSEDLLEERTVETMLAGLSTRRYQAALEPTGAEGSSTSRSAASRRFVRRTRERLGELMSRPVPEDLVVLMLDGVSVAEHTCVVALGIEAATAAGAAAMLENSRPGPAAEP